MPHNRDEVRSYSREVGFDQCIEYSSGNAIYIGLANPGSSKASAVWAIKKLSYDVDSNMVEARYADGTDDFTKVWNDRATYSYSGI